MAKLKSGYSDGERLALTFAIIIVLVGVLYFVGS